MPEQKFSYRVKPGFTHGAFNQCKAGDTVALTTQEAAGFLDKLELVGESQPALVVSGNGLELSSTGISSAITGGTVNGVSHANTFSDTPPEPFDVASATVDEVVAAVNEGKVTASDALIAEQQGKKRATLIEALTKLADAESQTKQE